jgi:uncharacterized membrane protein YgdD (TMEM256/DUF423 family)
MDRRVFAMGSLLAGLGVMLGAFGAHALRDRIAADLLEVFETGVRYQMYHALGLMLLAVAMDRWPGRGLGVAAWLLGVGTVVFSGTLVLLALTGIRWLGAITPVGGVLLILGWSLTSWRLLKSPNLDRKY